MSLQELKMKPTILFAMIAALAAPVAAQAEAYIGANVGRAEQKVEVSGISFKENDTGFKLYGGYNFNQNFGIEGGFADLGDAKRSANNASISSKAQSIYVAATGILPLNDQFALFGKAGVATTHVKLKASAPGIAASASDNHASPFVGVGASFALNKNVSFVAEYEYFGKIAKDGDDSIKANMISAGVRYSF
jgi:OOP family OmpA-OmpF porin